MSWETTLTLIVRHLIDDLDQENYRYNDCRIHEAIVVAAIYVTQDYDFSTDYTFDFDDPDISPDPTITAYYDPIAITLFSLRAACILDTNRYQNSLTNGAGIRIKDGDSEVDTKNQLQGFKDILTLGSGPCGTYNKLIQEKQWKASMNAGKAIVSPFSHEDYNISGLQFGSIVSYFDNFCRSYR